MKAITSSAKWLAILLTVHTVLMASGLLLAQEGGLFSFLTPSRTKTANKLKLLALAMHNYHDVYKKFPPSGLIYPKPDDATAKEKPKEMLSWRVRILPFIEQQRLYDQFNFNEPWDGPTNKPLLSQMPEIFKPAGVTLDDPTKTVFLAVTLDPDGEEFGKAAQDAQVRGAATCFDNIIGIRRPPGLLCQRIANCIDGTSNTIMIVEADASKAVPWTKPEDLGLQFADPWKGLGTLRKGGFNFAMADGSVGSIDKVGTDAKTLLYGMICNDRVNNQLPRKAVR